MSTPNPHTNPRTKQTTRTITGVICLSAICLPLLIAPFRLDNSLSFVTEFENRTPNEFPKLEHASDLMDNDWWTQVSKSFEDRAPFRKQIVTLERTINPPMSGIGFNRKVELGVDNWLFFRKSLDKDLGTLEETQLAIEAIEGFVVNNEFKADLFIVVAPNKVTIYPEKLSEPSQAKFATSLPQRELLAGYFASEGKPFLLDVWTPMLALKATTDELIYEPGGSHYNSLGAMVMARAMIDAADPTLWNDTDRMIEWQEPVVPDIAKMIGDYEHIETHTRIQIRRPGVEFVELWDEQDPENHRAIEDPQFLSSNEISYYHPRHAIMRSQSTPLIPGKTLILFDSFIGHYLHPTLTQFFEDVRFVHIGTADQAYLIDALNTYDRVYFQSAERHIIPRAIEFFATPEQQALYETNHRPK